jgi:hypothetical protein
MNADLAYMTAVGAVHAHEKADFEKAAGQVNNMWYDALANMPYVTQGKTGTDMLEAERMKLVEEFQRMKLQERTPPGLQPLTDTDTE